MANSIDPDFGASDLGLLCLLTPACLIYQVKYGSGQNLYPKNKDWLRPELSVLQVLQVPPGTINLAGLAGSARNYQTWQHAY